MLVRQDKVQEKAGSLFVPQGSEYYPPIGTVLAIGAVDHPPGFAVGDRVYFKRQADSALVPDAREICMTHEEWQDLVMLSIDNVLMVIDGE